MKNDEAKFILSAYRPGGDDAGDSRFAEAIGQAERDPELAGWFAEARRFDGAMSEALSSIPIPTDLRANILAGGKISRPRWGPARRTIFALAAGIVLLAAVAGVWFNRTPGLERWQRDALAFIPQLGSGAARFDMENKDAVVLQRWLEAQNAPAALPETLRTLSSLGCKTISSAGRSVSIICFKMETGELLHLAVTEQGSSSSALATSPRFVEEDGWRTASWNASGHAYMLATKASAPELRAVVSGLKIAAHVRSSAPVFAISGFGADHGRDRAEQLYGREKADFPSLTQWSA